MSHSVEIPPPKESAPSAANNSTSGLNTIISLAVALGGTFMALCSVKEGNISEGMAEAQSKTVNGWSYFQSKSTKQNLAEATLEQLRVTRSLNTAASAEVLADLDKKVTSYVQKVERYEKEKADIKKEVEDLEKRYEALDRQGDQFDLSDAAMSVGIALCGVAALVERKGLLAVALVFIVLGFAMGVAGFIGVSIPLPLLGDLLK
jgi:hypothetical protein